MFFASLLLRRGGAFCQTGRLLLISSDARNPGGSASSDKLANSSSFSSPSSAGVAGVYVAWHPWLDHVHGPRNLFKIGFSDNLAVRLTNDSYRTCFPEGWEYVATFEVRRTDEARLLERAVLHVASSRVVPSRELIHCPEHELVELIKNSASLLGLTYRFRLRPKYILPREELPDSPLKSLFGVKSFTTSKRQIIDWTAASMKLDRLLLPPLVGSGSGSSTSAVVGGLLQGALDTAHDMAHHEASAAKTVSSSSSMTVSSSLSTLAGQDDVISSANMEEDEDSIAAKVMKIVEQFEEIEPSEEEAVEELGEADECNLAEALEKISSVAYGVAHLQPNTTASSSSSPSLLKPVELRDYQQEAVRQCIAELEKTSRTTLVMACRCGKTPVALAVLMHFLKRPISGSTGNSNRDSNYSSSSGEDGVGEKASKTNFSLSSHSSGKDPLALFLVPGLPLLRQTSQKLASYGAECKILLVGSDPRVVQLACGVSTTMTTDQDTIHHFIHIETGPRLIVSTYQSSQLFPSDVFDITVFDECHRVCGKVEPSPFNHVLLSPQRGYRLFMTATPVLHGVINMKRREMFGSTAFRYSLRQGVNDGFVNSYKLRIVAGPLTSVDYVDHIVTAMKMVDQMLVFCSSIEECESVAAKLSALTLPSDVKPFVTAVAHSRMKQGTAAEVILKTMTTKRMVIVNCRLFQEGVEIPTLNAVFFAAPRTSPREIVQGMCRPLTLMASKPPSYIFLPILHDRQVATHTIPNLRRYAAIVPFAEALLSEDSRVYDSLCDPANSHDFRVVGTKNLLMSNDQLELFVMPNLWRVMTHTRSMRRKLLRPACVPWEKGLRELRRIVMTCNRYPRSSDAWVVGLEEVNISAFYRLAIKGYLEESLEPYQRFELEALPHWLPYGLHGPFPWNVCVGILKKWLAANNGQAPPADVRCAYTGLEATELERLSGLFLQIQLMDTYGGLRMPLGKQQALDEACAPYGIRWSKPRDPATNVVIESRCHETLVAASAAAFQVMLASSPDKKAAFLDEHFPGFPQKHQACESSHVLTSGTAPLRRKKKSLGSRIQELEFVKTTDSEGRIVYQCKVCHVVIPEVGWEVHAAGKAHSSGLKKLVDEMINKQSRRKALAYEQSKAMSSSNGDTVCVGDPPPIPVGVIPVKGGDAGEPPSSSSGLATATGSTTTAHTSPTSSSSSATDGIPMGVEIAGAEPAGAGEELTSGSSNISNKRNNNDKLTQGEQEEDDVDCVEEGPPETADGRIINMDNNGGNAFAKTQQKGAKINNTRLARAEGGDEDAAAPPHEAAGERSTSVADDGDDQTEPKAHPQLAAAAAAVIFTPLANDQIGCVVCGTTFHASFLAAHEASTLHNQAVAAARQSSSPKGTTSATPAPPSALSTLPACITKTGAGTFTCSLCDVHSIVAVEIPAHLSSRKHINNTAVRKLVLELFDPVTSRPLSPEMRFIAMAGGPHSDRCFCECCNITMHVNLVVPHAKGRQHIRAAEQFAVTFDSVVGLSERSVFEQVLVEEATPGDPSGAAASSTSSFSRVKVRCIPCGEVMFASEVVAHKTVRSHVMRISAAASSSSSSSTLCHSTPPPDMATTLASACASATAAVAPVAGSLGSSAEKDRGGCSPDASSPSPSLPSLFPYLAEVPGSGGSVRCSACAIVLPSNAVNAHVRSKLHVRNALFQDVIAKLTPDQRDILEINKADQSVRCKCCETVMDINALGNHFAGKTHERNLTRMIFSGASVSDKSAPNGESIIMV